MTRLDDGTYVLPLKETFGEFLDGWIEASRTRVRASTWESYERNVRVHIKPRVGSAPLQQLAPAHLIALYARFLQRRTPRRPRTSPSHCALHPYDPAQSPRRRCPLEQAHAQPDRRSRRAQSESHERDPRSPTRRSSNSWPLLAQIRSWRRCTLSTGSASGDSAVNRQLARREF